MTNNKIPTPYNIIADNFCSKPKIVFEYRDLTEKQMRYAVKCLACGFRKVEVTNNETGEVIYTHYESDEIFCPSFTETEVIDNFMMFMATINE